MATELNEYFCTDGRSFSSVFYRGTGGDQSFGIYTSDGIDVGQQYQRAITTFNSGFFVGNEDIGRKLLNTEALVKIEHVGENVRTYNNRYAKRSSYLSDETPNFTFDVKYKITGGSGQYAGYEWFSDGDRFGDVHFLNVNGYSKVKSVYSPSTHILTGTVKAFGWTRRGDKWYRGNENWWQFPINPIRCRFNDSITGVSYVTPPFYFVQVDHKNLKDYPEWNWLNGRCDVHSTNDPFYSCSLDYYDDCCEGHND